ncbi:MAG: inner membrane-spanning protein YciB [Rhizomicrobium sp.]
MYFLQAFRPIGLDLLATIFFVTLFWLTGNILLATSIGVVAGVARFAYIKIRKQPVGPLQYLSVILVVVAGVTTLITKDPHFVMIKSSLISLAVASVMLRTNWMEPYLPPIVKDNLDEWVIAWASRGWGILLVLLAVANAVVALEFSTNVWAWYASLVPASTQLLAFLVQYAIFRTLIRRNIRARLAAQPAE